MSNFTEYYNELLQKNGYVQILRDDLRIESKINNLLNLHNDSVSSKQRISKTLTIAEKRNKIQELKKEDTLRNKSFIENLESLLDFKEKCDKEKYKSGEINKKRKYIVKSFKGPKTTIKKDLIFVDEKIKLEEIKSISSYWTLLKKYDLLKECFFRGQQNLNNPVIPGIFRGKWIDHERDFIEKMQIHNAHDFENTKTTLEKLVKMQHYGVPTRLLDLTSNPFIALFFACETNDHEKNDGEIIFFKRDNNLEEKYFDSDTIAIVSNLAMMADSFKADEKASVDEFNNQTSIQYLIHQIQMERVGFLPIINHEDLHKCFVVHVKLDNKRIANQQGLFLLVGMGKKKTDPANIDQYMYRHNGKKLVFHIPNKYKQAIIEDLKGMGIDRKLIYPEIDDVANYLKNEQYKRF